MFAYVYTLASVATLLMLLQISSRLRRIAESLEDEHVAQSPPRRLQLPDEPDMGVSRSVL